MKSKVLPVLFTLTIVCWTNLFAQEETVVLTDKEKAIFETAEKNPDDAEQEAEDSTEYDIIIMDIGFNRWLNQIAQPKGYYTQSYMEQRNYLMVVEWNRRVLQPQVFDPMLYELQINYDQNIDYGYDVNYQLYNYFIYFQRRYNQRLGPFIPRI